MPVPQESEESSPISCEVIKPMSKPNFGDVYEIDKCLVLNSGVSIR